MQKKIKEAQEELIKVVKSENPDVERISYLISQIGKKNFEDYNYCILHKYLENNENPSFEILEVLISNGASFYAGYLSNPILTAVLGQKNPKKEVVEFLIKKGRDLNFKAYLAKPPFEVYLLEQNPKIEILEWLIELKADINSHCGGSTPALKYILQKEDKEIIKFLFEKKAEINGNKNRELPYLHECLKGEKDSESMIDLLLSYGAEINGTNKETDGHLVTYHNLTPLLLYVTWYNCKPRIVEYLISKGADINAVECKYKFSIMHLALQRSGDPNIELLETLISNGAKVNTLDIFKHTPLHKYITTEYVQVKVLELLVSKGADIKIKDSSSSTLLHLHLKLPAPKLEVVNFLIEKGIDVNEIDKYKSAALHNYLKVNCDYELLLLMFSKGADINLRGYQTLSPFHHFSKLSNVKVESLILFLTRFKKLDDKEDWKIIKQNLSKNKDTEIHNLLSLFEEKETIWNVSTHKHFPKRFQEKVFAVYICNKHLLPQSLKIPKPILQTIVSYSSIF